MNDPDWGSGGARQYWKDNFVLGTDNKALYDYEKTILNKPEYQQRIWDLNDELIDAFIDPELRECLTMMLPHGTKSCEMQASYLTP